MNVRRGRGLPTTPTAPTRSEGFGCRVEVEVGAWPGIVPRPRLGKERDDQQTCWKATLTPVKASRNTNENKNMQRVKTLSSCPYLPHRWFMSDERTIAILRPGAGVRLPVAFDSHA
jgi:hypothetical protein